MFVWFFVFCMSDDLDLLYDWDWRGFEFEVRVGYKRCVGLVDGEVVCDFSDTVSEAVVGELYDYGKFLCSKDSSQNGFNCPVCDDVYGDRCDWEKHVHLCHFEEFSKSFPAPMVKDKYGSVKHFRDLDFDDSLDEVVRVMGEWREYRCMFDYNRGFSASLLGDHLIKNHPEEVFF